MNRAKSFIFKLPEYYLTLLVILVGFTPLYYFNPITIGFLALLIFQIIVKNAISGLVIAGSFLIIHLFMLVALVV